MKATSALLIVAVVNIALSPLLQAGASSARVHLVGGTGASLTQKAEGDIQLSDEDAMVFASKGASIRVPYENINTLEYGQKVDRRYLEAILISPLMLLAKRRTHFLTIGYVDEGGHQQAMVFRVDSSDVRILLAGLEAKTGRRVEFQDDDARKTGKG
jgi:hypothetical protein